MYNSIKLHRKLVGPKIAHHMLDFRRHSYIWQMRQPQLFMQSGSYIYAYPVPVTDSSFEPLSLKVVTCLRLTHLPLHARIYVCTQLHFSLLVYAAAIIGVS